MTEVFSAGAARAWAVLYYLSPSDDGECESTLRAIADVRSAAAVAAFADGNTTAARLVIRPDEPARFEHLGPTNAGDPATFEQFLAWAFDECRAQRYVLVLGGLAPGPAALAVERLIEIPDFTVAFDVVSNDALEVVEFADVLRRMFPKNSGRTLFMIGCDTFPLQFLEVAHELRDCTHLLVGMQPDDRSRVLAPWPYASLLQRWETVFEPATTSERQRWLGGIDSDAHALVEEAFSALGTQGAASDSPAGSALSSINMSRLPLLTEAVDVFTATYVQWLSNQVIWRVRDAVVRKLQGRLQRSWSYDIGAFAGAMNEALEACDHEALAQWAAHVIPSLPSARLSPMLRAFGAAARELAVREPEPYLPLSQSIARCRSELERAIASRGDTIDNNILREVRGLFLDGTTLLHPLAWQAIITASQHRFTGVVAMELAEIFDGIATAGILRRSVTRISSLVRSKAAGEEIVKTAREDSRCGLALYRPLDLEQMADSAYVRLRFSREFHWSALLTAVNLVEHHSLALWRVVSGQLAGGSAVARTQIISKLTGDRALTGRHAAGFRALSGPHVLILSIERESETRADLPSDVDSYRVTLSSAQGLTVERRNQVTAERLKRVLGELDAIRRGEQLDSRRVFEQLARCGSLLGDDLLYGISDQLTEVQSGQDGVPHLIVETPREMSDYPWELLRDRNGFLLERFAISRRVRGESSVAIGRRHYSPLRILLLAPRDERSNPNVMGGLARHVATTLTELQEAWPGLVAPSNFAKYIDVALSAEQARRLLVTRAYDVVHFVGRVDILSETDSGGWLFSDGSLDPSDLEALLAQANGVPALVWESWIAGAKVLDEGITPSKFEMAAAGLRAGVAAWVGASHSLREDDARVLASAFYKTLLARHSTVGEALGVGRSLLMGPPAKRTEPPPLSRWMDAHDTPESRQEPTTAWLDIVMFGDPTMSLVHRFRPSD